METRMPNGDLLREEFESTEAMFKRFGELSARGGKMERMYVPSPSKYAPHQGKREVERRLRRLQLAAPRGPGGAHDGGA